MPYKSAEARRAAYYRDHEKHLLVQAAFREQNREALAAKRRRYYEENKAAVCGRQKIFAKKNRASITAQSAEYRERTREQRRAWARAYVAARREKDPVFKLQMNLRCRLNMAIRKLSVKGSAVRLLGCSGEFAARYIEAQFRPGMSWANWGEWHIDHRKALVSFDLTDPEQLAAACHYSNLQPLWAVENTKKGAR